MDFNKFQEWCQNRGFVVKLPSGYSKLINLDVSSFESFKGIFNLCMLFFYEELYKQREEEKEDGLRKFIEKYKDSPTILYPAYDDGSNPYIYYKKNGESFVEKIRDAGVNKNKSSWNLEKYSDEDIEKVLNYLLTPNVKDGNFPIDRLLNYLENSQNFLEKKEKEKTLKQEKYEDSEFKTLVDRVADKYDSEDSTAP